MKKKHIIAYLKCALAFADCSNATRLKVGSVIVKNNRIISCGYNALPQHISDPCELEDGTTNPLLRHSERNALMGLIRSNESALNSIMFCTHSCCELCSVDIVDAGIKKFYYIDEYRSNKGILHLLKNNVKVIKVDINLNVFTKYRL